MPPAGTHLPAAASSGWAPGIPKAPTGPAPLGRDLAGIHFWHESLTFLGHVCETGRIGVPGRMGKPSSATSDYGSGDGDLPTPGTPSQP